MEDHGPVGRLIRSPLDAEEVACEWMRFWGYPDARLTDKGADGGVDLVSSRAVVQVKAETAPVGRPVVQAISGIASSESKRAALFSLSGLTTQALEWANQSGVACFRFDLQGNPEPLNRAAHSFMKRSEDSEACQLLARDAPIQVDLLPASILDSLVWEGHANVAGRARHLPWTDDDVIWQVQHDGGSEVVVNFYPLNLGAQWVRRRHPTLSTAWVKTSVVEALPTEMKSSVPDLQERAYRLVEERRDCRDIYYWFSRDEGEIELTVRGVVREIDQAARAFGARLSEMRFDPGQTRREAARAFLETMRSAQRRVPKSGHLP